MLSLIHKFNQIYTRSYLQFIYDKHVQNLAITILVIVDMKHDVIG